MYESIFLGRTLGAFLALLLIWFGVLCGWLVFKPSLASAIETLSKEDAERYRAVYKMLSPLIGVAWIFAGMVALTAYGVEALNWPHPNWLGATFVPGLRVSAEILFVGAFGQGVDLVLSGACMVESWIRRQKLECKLGPLRRPLLWFLRNSGIVYSFILVGLVAALKYQGAATDMVLGIAGTLILSRVFARASWQLQKL